MIEARVVLTDNKHVYARRTGDVIEVRLPRWLPVHEQEALVQRMLKSPKLQQKKLSFWNALRDAGEVQWAWGDVWKLDAALCHMPEKAFRRWLLEEARRDWLPQIEAELRGFAVQLGAKKPMGKVGIRDLHSRWGSCSADGNISISLGTLLLPYPLFAYVCAHEVAHLAQMNHGPRFWAHLEKVLPDAVARRKELHTYHIS